MSSKSMDFKARLEGVEAICEDLALVRGSLLTDEFAWWPQSLESDDLDAEVHRWQILLDDGVVALLPAELASLPPPDFQVRLQVDPPVYLRLHYSDFRKNAFDAFVTSPTLSKADQAPLVEELVQSRERFDESEDELYPLFSVYTSLSEWIASNPLKSASAPSVASKLPETSAPINLRQTLLWSHHLLATGKRKNIVQWARELRLWGLSKPGYPGVIFVEGVLEDVGEFVHRIKQLNWKALQVRSESPPIPCDVPSSIAATERELWAVRNAASLGKVLGGEVPGVTEVEGLYEVGEIMRKAGLENVFLTALKLAKD